MGSLGPHAFRVRRVAIIGAGPSGLAAAKYLGAQDAALDTIDIFEQQGDIGGIWNYSSVAPAPCPAPQTDPFFPPDAPLPARPGHAPVFPSPLYERLHSNIPGSLMSYSDKSFLADSCVFPSRGDIQQYLLEYAEDVRHLIRFCFQVTALSCSQVDGHDRWRLTARSTLTDEVVDDAYDAVVVANGHYSVPFTPAVPGMEPFHQAFPSVIAHSKQYRTAEAFEGRKTVIVGNGPSGLDIALQINQVSKGRVLLSVRTPTPPGKLAHTGCEEVPEIAEFLVDRRGVRFKNGRIETDIDAVVFCTGFFYSYPFLPDLGRSFITDGRGVHGLYKHLFCIRHPTLVFPALKTKSVTWPVAEAQAAVFSAVWSNDVKLPSVEDMERWSRELEKREGPVLHADAPLADGLYINELHDWVARAERVGKTPPRWGDDYFWRRSVFAEAKVLFEEQGCRATTLEELGLCYDAEWRKNGRVGLADDA